MSLRHFWFLRSELPLRSAPKLGSSGGGSTATRVQQLPLSGRTQGSSVGIGQSTAGAAGTGSVNTLNSTLQVQGDLQGSVPGNDPVTQQPLSLTLAQAVKRGLQFNLSALVSNNAQRAAIRGKARCARANAARYKRGRARGRSNKLTLPRPACVFPRFRSFPASRASISPASSVRSITSTSEPASPNRWQTSPSA